MRVEKERVEKECKYRKSSFIVVMFVLLSIKEAFLFPCSS